MGGVFADVVEELAGEEEETLGGDHFLTDVLGFGVGEIGVVEIG